MGPILGQRAIAGLIELKTVSAHMINTMGRPRCPSRPADNCAACCLIAYDKTQRFLTRHESVIGCVLRGDRIRADTESTACIKALLSTPATGRIWPTPLTAIIVRAEILVA